MPRPRKNGSSSQSLSPGQASYVIDRLIRERRVSSGDVSRYLDEMRGEISDLEERLNRLRAAHGGFGGGSSSSASTAAAAPAPARRRPGRPAGSGAGRPGRPPGRRPGRPAKAAAAPAAAAQGNAGNEGGTSAKGGAGRKGRKQRSAITPEQLASRQLQGRYLALVRQFPENKRAQYARTAKEKGREAAIKEMQDSLKK